MQIISLIHPPPSFASVSWSIFAPCEESDSRMVLLSNERGLERPATAVRSLHGISVQPDTPTFLASPPSRDVCYSAHAEVKPLHVVLS